MNALIGKTPFLRLLLPVIAGIAAGALFPQWPPHLFCVSFAGLLLMLLPNFTRKEKQYPRRWMFGAGVTLFLFSLAFLQYREQERNTRLLFPHKAVYYRGFLIDIPQNKPRSIACNVKTTAPVQQKVKLYLPKDSAARELKPGDEIIFYGMLQPFRNFGNPDDFNYERFMKIKGFSGSAYIPAPNWQKTGRQSGAIIPRSQRWRLWALERYRMLIGDEDARAFIAALTLGYKDDLSEDIQEAFRASGTAHVLAVSGLHVGIIYVMINLFFSFLGKSGWKFILRQWLVILVLWLYVFLAGSSASTMRAATMLTIFCLGNMHHLVGFTYNTLAATAFFILLFRPFNLFDVSFQMSFGAVAAILFFQPGFYAFYHPKSRTGKYIWDLLTVSAAAQLGVFPLVLYYFGTFPTWFFITNLLIVPLVGAITYAAVILMAAGVLNDLAGGVINGVESAFQWITETLAQITLHIVHISESLPFAQLTDSYISAIRVVLLFLFVFSSGRFLFSHRPRPLIIALASLFSFQTATLAEELNKPAPQLVVLNSYERSEIALFADHKRHFIKIPENGFLPHPEKRILHLSDNIFAGYSAEKPFSVDVLVLSQGAGFQIEQLLTMVSPAVIVLDSSIPQQTATRIHSECNLLDIEVHDVTLNGAYSVNF